MRIIKDIPRKIIEGNDKRRRIECEKSRVDAKKIALVGEFYYSAIKPMAEREGSVIAKAYNESGAEKHKDLLKLWIATEGIEVFPVTMAMMRVPMPSFTYKRLFGTDPGPVATIPETRRARGHVTGEYVRDANLTHVKWAGYETTYPAIRVGDMLKAMDCALQAPLDLREWHALLRGDGDTLINFWHAVNTLRGYNKDFEKEDGPDFGRRRPNKTKKAPPVRTGRRLIDWGPEPQGI